MLENVPFWIGNGAEHSSAIARNVAYNATSGATGIAEPNEFKVTATPTPGESVRVAGGSYVIKSTYAGQNAQSYTGRSTGSVDVEIPATGSTGGKTYYLVIAIYDPEFYGTVPQTEEEIQNYEYARFKVETSLNRPYPILPLAKIVLPANTATVENKHITDLRKLANPKRETVVFSRPRVAADAEAGPKLNATWSTGGEYFPGGGGSPNEWQVEVPEWATRMNIRAEWISVAYAGNSNPYGSYVVQFGDEYRTHTWPDKRQWEYSTQAFSFNSPGKSNDGMRMNWPLADTVPIASKLRGKTITLAFIAGLSTSDYKGKVSMDGGSGLTMEVTFAQSALDVDTV